MNSDDMRTDASLNDDDAFAAPEQERREALVTAYALGQVDATAKAEVERLLGDPMSGEARAHVAEVQTIATALKAGVDREGVARSAELRRAVLAAVTRPEPAPQRRGSRRWMLFVGAIAASLMVALLLTRLHSSGNVARERLVAAARPTAEPQMPTEQTAQAIGRREDIRADEKAAEPEARGLSLEVAQNGSQVAAADKPTAGLARERDALPAAPLAASGQAAGIASEELRRAAGDREAVAKWRESAKSQPVVEPSDRMIDRQATIGGERYATVTENRPVAPQDHPLSTFSIDVDTASYANVRRFLDSGRLPPRDAVRIEELVNYFSYDYPQPEGDVPFSVTVDAAECPWNRGHRLVRIGLRGRSVDRTARPRGNLVFLVDVSGSMQAANKLPLVQQALSMLVEELGENDRVSIVTYAGNAGLVLPPTTGDQKKTIRDAIESLAAGGSTHGSAGIALAYEQAREHFIEGGANRVILATDGDLNVGVTSTTALTDLIKDKAKGGVFLTVLGFGEGNLQDEKMEALADNGNGIYAYIDGAREARKVLVEQLSGSTVTIAKDVKIQVEFNPAQVASYRLLGYENRALAARDFRDDTKDAGEIGAGHRVTALYEVALADEGAGRGPGVEPLKYQPLAETSKPAADVAIDPAVSRELLTVKLRWKRPEGDESTGLEVPLTDRGPVFADAPADLRFAAAVAAFGMILRNSDQKGDATLPMIATIAGGSLGRDEGGYRAEFLDLVRKAESLRSQ